MPRVYIYVISRDFGFAPNPFHGFCTLATCKPGIRSTAKVDDWVFGVGGASLKATGQCIFAMKVTNKISFNEYWSNPIYNDKKPVRNGSKKMLLGDNIYFYDHKSNDWNQVFSHHSNPDGSKNLYNLKRDTKSKNVLISNHFFYFGSKAPYIPKNILSEIGFYNKIGHRVYELNEAYNLVNWITQVYANDLNMVLGDPFNFDKSDAHYSVNTNKITINSF